MSKYKEFDEIPKPMLVSKTPPDWKKKLESGDYIGTEKVDGYWYQLIRNEDGDIFLYSRSPSKKTGNYSEKIANVPHIKEWAEDNIPCDSIIIGEIYYPGKTSKDVTKIMGSLPAKAIQRQFDTDEFGGPIHYYIHDVIKWDSKDIAEEPYTAREQIVFSLSPEPKYSDYIEIAETYYINLEDKLHEIFENGGEGMVFRHKDSTYKPGKRPKEVFKMKTEETFDVVVMGFVDPVKEYNGKEIDTWQYWIDGEPVTKMFYNGWKAGFIVGLYDIDGVLHSVGNITSGMTDFLREDTAKHPERYIECVIEINAMSVDPNELSIRHGRLRSIRPDKNEEECTIESVFK